MQFCWMKSQILIYFIIYKRCTNMQHFIKIYVKNIKINKITKVAKKKKKTVLQVEY